MSYINILVSNQRFCPEVIEDDGVDTYVLNGSEYGAMALGRYLGIRNTAEWKTNPPNVEITIQESVGNFGRKTTSYTFRAGTFEKSWSISEL